jgi:phosphatidate cytidylyltransferase
VLKARLATVVATLPVLVVAMLAGGWPWTLLVAAGLSVAATEYYRAAGVAAPGAVLGVGLVAAQPLAAHVGDECRQIALVAGVIAPGLWPVLRGRSATALADWSLVAFGVLYFGWLGSHAVVVRDLPDGRQWLFLGVFLAFATDTAAFLVGRTVGRHHLAPLISPRKTWEGAIAGWLCGAATILLLAAVLALPVSRGQVLFLGAVLPIAAQLGDLAKSAVKRSLGIKDFGRILPGHGGMADRIDSMLFAIPVMASWLQWTFLG